MAEKEPSTMSNLGDDELALILNWVYDHNDRKSCSLVSKQWLRVEGQTRSFIRILELDDLQSFLPRFPNLLHLESQLLIPDSHLQFIAQMCPKIEFLNFNLKPSRGGEYFHGLDEFPDFSDFGDNGVRSLAKGCCNLTKVLLRRRKNVSNHGIITLVNLAQNLTTLDLGWCNSIDDQSLEAIRGLHFIRVLNLEGCSLITDRGLGFLANGSSSRSLKKLILADCDRVTDFGVSLLRGMCCLEELNLAECGPKVTDNGGMVVASIPSLKRLNISWLINVSDITLVAIAENCEELVALVLTGCEMITGAGVRAFANHKRLESLVLASCYSICGNDVEMVLKCKTLRQLVLDKGLRMWIPARTQENISRSCQLHWR